MVDIREESSLECFDSTVKPPVSVTSSLNFLVQWSCVDIGNRLNASAFRDLWAQVMGVSKTQTFKTKTSDPEKLIP